MCAEYYKIIIVWVFYIHVFYAQRGHFIFMKTGEETHWKLCIVFLGKNGKSKVVRQCDIWRDPKKSEREETNAEYSLPQGCLLYTS